MIKTIKIENFKSIKSLELDFQGLNILTGTNSSGKSSIIQAILLLSSRSNRNQALQNYCDELGEDRNLLSVDSTTKEILIQAETKDGILYNFRKTFENNNSSIESAILEIPLVFEKNLYFLSANRLGPESICPSNNFQKFGTQGEYVFGFYQKNYDKPIESTIFDQIQNWETPEEQYQKLSPLLNNCASFWLKRILNLDLQLSVEYIDPQRVKPHYKDPKISFSQSPYALGAGISYLAKILIVGLSLKQGDILIIENPEIHLHPKAISKLAEFFVVLAKSGIQVILETHSEYIINKVRYLIYKNQFDNKSVMLVYRNNDTDFQKIHLNPKGKYLDSDNQIIDFPSGFFDVSLNELLEMA